MSNQSQTLMKNTYTFSKYTEEEYKQIDESFITYEECMKNDKRCFGRHWSVDYTHFHRCDKNSQFTVKRNEKFYRFCKTCFKKETSTKPQKYNEIPLGAICEPALVCQEDFTLRDNEKNCDLSVLYPNITSQENKTVVYNRCPPKTGLRKFITEHQFTGLLKKPNRYKSCLGYILSDTCSRIINRRKKVVKKPVPVQTPDEEQIEEEKINKHNHQEIIDYLNECIEEPEQKQEEQIQIIDIKNPRVIEILKTNLKEFGEKLQNILTVKRCLTVKQGKLTLKKKSKKILKQVSRILIKGSLMKVKKEFGDIVY